MSAVISGPTITVATLTAATITAASAATPAVGKQAGLKLLHVLKRRLFPSVRIRNLREDVTNADGTLTCWWVVKVTNKTTHDVGIRPLQN